jgi:drug/metabolite transporter (DMT)-like permease
VQCKIIVYMYRSDKSKSLTPWLAKRSCMVYAEHEHEHVIVHKNRILFVLSVMSYSYTVSCNTMMLKVYMVIYVACWSASTILDKKTLETTHEALLGCTTFLLAFLSMACMLFWTSTSPDVIKCDILHGVSNPMLWLSCGITSLGYVTYFLILKQSSVFAFTLLGPIIEVTACLASFAVFGDVISSSQVCGIVCILVGSIIFGTDGLRDVRSLQTTAKA